MPLEEVHERITLTYWLTGMKRDRLENMPDGELAKVQLAELTRPEWKPEVVRAAQLAIFDRLESSPAEVRRLMEKYRPDWLLLDKANHVIPPTRGGSWEHVATTPSPRTLETKIELITYFGSIFCGSGQPYPANAIPRIWPCGLSESDVRKAATGPFEGQWVAIHRYEGIDESMLTAQDSQAVRELGSKSNWTTRKTRATVTFTTDRKNHPARRRPQRTPTCCISPIATSSTRSPTVKPESSGSTASGSHPSTSTTRSAWTAGSGANSASRSDSETPRTGRLLKSTPISFAFVLRDRARFAEGSEDALRRTACTPFGSFDLLHFRFHRRAGRSNRPGAGSSGSRQVRVRRASGHPERRPKIRPRTAAIRKTACLFPAGSSENKSCRKACRRCDPVRRELPPHGSRPRPFPPPNALTFRPTTLVP